jgi:putative peptidoglycan lipid II flippase
MFPLKLSGLAIANSISGINSFLILFFLLRNRLKPFSIKPIASSFLRVLAASLLMGVVCYFSAKNSLLPDLGALNKILNLGYSISLGVISYILFCVVFRVPELKELWGWIMRKEKD